MAFRLHGSGDDRRLCRMKTGKNLVETLHQELKAKGKVDLADVIQTVFDEEKAELIITEIKKALDKYEKDKQKEQQTRR